MHTTGNFRHNISTLRSKLSTHNNVQYIAKAGRYNMSKNQEKFLGTTCVCVYVGGGAKQKEESVSGGHIHVFQLAQRLWITFSITYEEGRVW